MNKNTGQRCTGLDHLKQSIHDILSTPLGSRVMRRDYGSKLFELIDAPMNQNTLVQIYSATAEALNKWEPRFKLLKVMSDQIAPGKLQLTLEGEYLPVGQRITLEGIVI